MDAFPAFLATKEFGLAFSVIYRIAAFLARYIRACSMDASSAMTPQIRARIVTVAARLSALPRKIARVAEHALWRTPPRHALPGRTRARRDRGRRGVSSGASKTMMSTRKTFGCMVAVVAAASHGSGIAFEKKSRATPPPSAFRKGGVKGAVSNHRRNALVHRAVTGARPEPVANFRQAFATGARRLTHDDA